MLECKTLLATGGKQESIYYFAYFALLLRSEESITAFMFFCIYLLAVWAMLLQTKPFIHRNPTTYLSFVLLVTAALVHGLYDNCLNWDGQLSSGVLLKEKC